MQPDLADDEMRITFLGTMGGPPVRRAQQQMSIFVEVGPWMPDPGHGFGKAKDSFVFDLGGGCLGNYAAMGIPYSRMDKVFIAHLHADHMNDLTDLQQDLRQARCEQPHAGSLESQRVGGYHRKQPGKRDRSRRNAED